MNRLFLAIKAQVQDYNKLQSDFTSSIKGRWMPEENLHVTLCYFGDKYSIDELLEVLPILVNEIESLSLESLGFFEHNNILYAKVKKSKNLEMLQKSICGSFSLTNEKPFIPHVTLMRIKDIDNKKAFNKMLKNYKNKTLSRLDTRIELINSHLSKNGAQYESIKKI